MPRHYPTIDLAGYQRLHDLESRIWYSPAAIVLTLVALVAAGYAFWGLSRGFPTTPHHTFIGYALVLSAYGCFFAYYRYRFRYLKCPDCQQVMQPYITDLSDERPLNLLPQLRIGGRTYRRPYDEDDRRPWVRLMAHVRACDRCKNCVSCSRLHFETCTAEELTQIHERAGA